ncbi:unnamed protein product [Vitrella brassicaformis CCMP3155]|uniref:Uncharacterized protein n=1 Tax=Vitrella brassicaformis (strain CCMP3155) TaxID=1169540 RepID=A0A0G4EKI9_VITBC|nr:unnamed protein product [Vitrella brassicaformis CCMP3155]|eukprot:CEL97636.1 unnamed protein product [Vitrella brassicaformis CCMP3155]
MQGLGSGFVRSVMAASCSSDAIGPKEDSSATAADESAQAAHPLSDNEEIKPELSAMISDTPGLLDCVAVFLPLHLRVYVSRHMREAVAPHHTRLVISPADKEERSVWERIPIGLVKGLAASLTRLTSIIFCYPVFATLWCFDVFITFVEGHAEGRRTANMQGGSLQTIVLEKVSLSWDKPRLQRCDLPLPPPAVPPPTLHALTSVTGLADGVVTRRRPHRVVWTEPYGHSRMADRGWRMPSLARVEQTGWSCPSLGRFICTSRRLQHVDGDFSGGGWASAFEHLPVGDGGQPGPLSQLKSIGKIRILCSQRRASVESSGLRQLQVALSARGCRKSLTGLDVVLPPDPAELCGDLCALDGLVTNCCISPDVPVSVGIGTNAFNPFSLHTDHFPPNPTPTFRRTIQQVAQKIKRLPFSLREGPLPPATEAAIDLARTLSFDSATEVEVRVPFRATIPPQDSMIISHLQQLPPQAARLTVGGRPGLQAEPYVMGAVGAMVAAKMPKYVKEVIGESWVGEDAVRVLEGLGRDREVGSVKIKYVFLEQLTSTAATLPAIHELEVEGEPSQRSVRGLRRVEIHVDVRKTAVSDVVELLDRGTKLGSGFSVTNLQIDKCVLDSRDSDVVVTATRDMRPQVAAGAAAVASRDPAASHDLAAALSAGRLRVGAEMVDGTGTSREVGEGQRGRPSRELQVGLVDDLTSWAASPSAPVAVADGPSPSPEGIHHGQQEILTPFGGPDREMPSPVASREAP